MSPVSSTASASFAEASNVPDVFWIVNRFHLFDGGFLGADEAPVLVFRKLACFEFCNDRAESFCGFGVISARVVLEVNG